uniref:CHRNA7 (exons 5-10) and FAM7A (exons A-E) fusion n=1 Tax=Eptatretus burgeri TaxID=7764 RepID=A0A8C4X1Y0_EPTBU
MSVLKSLNFAPYTPLTPTIFTLFLPIPPPLPSSYFLRILFICPHIYLAWQYFASTMIIVALSVVMTTVVLQYHHHDPDGKKMPKWMRLVLLDWCAWFLRMKQPGKARHRLSRRLSVLHQSTVCSIDLALLVSGNQKGLSSNGYVFYQNTAENETPGPGTSDSGVMCGQETCFTAMSEQKGMCGHRGPGLLRILAELRYIAERFRLQDQEQAMASEWKFVAAVIDRLCMLAFSLFTIISTITILMSAPHFSEAVSKDFT